MSKIVYLFIFNIFFMWEMTNEGMGGGSRASELIDHCIPHKMGRMKLKVDIYWVRDGDNNEVIYMIANSEG